MANENIRKSYAGAATATVVVGTITSVSTLINALDASSYPDGSTGPFVVRLDSGQSNEEKVLVLARFGNLLSVMERGYDGTVAVGHSDVSLTHCLDAHSIDQANQMANVGTLGVPNIFPVWNGTTWEAAAFPSELVVAGSDEVTAIVAATGVMQFRMPYAMTGTSIRASLGSAAATGTFTVDVNIGGATVLSTKVTIDATEKTSQTAAVASVLSDTAWADDQIVTIDVDDAGNGTATGLKVTLIGTRSF
jgi:hypothetical protein